MKIFDLHSHFNTNSPFDCKGNMLHLRDMAFMKSEYDNCGICAGAFSSYASVLQTEDIVLENGKIRDISSTNDWIYQWAVVEPRQEETFVQVDKLLKEKKVLGIKIHSISHKYDIEKYADKIFSFANEHKCFVLMHPDKIEKMPYFADKYPNMKLIIAHLGSLEHIEAIRQAKHKNIFTDTSGGASNLNNIIEYAVKEIGSEKIFFGTDTYSCGFQRGRIEYARISKKDKENIFYKNAIKQFNLEI